MRPWVSTNERSNSYDVISSPVVFWKEINMLPAILRTCVNLTGQSESAANAFEPDKTKMSARSDSIFTLKTRKVQCCGFAGGHRGALGLCRMARLGNRY